MCNHLGEPLQAHVVNQWVSQKLGWRALMLASPSTMLEVDIRNKTRMAKEPKCGACEREKKKKREPTYK